MDRITNTDAEFAAHAACGGYAASRNPVLRALRDTDGFVLAGVAAYSQFGAGATAASTGTAADSHNSNDVEWTQHGGNPNEQRYSKLNQVTADKVGQLGLAWYADIPERGGYQSTPLVID